MIAITGNVPCDLIGRDSFQEIDITGITLPITKHNYFVQSADELPDIIREAFKIAKSGRPGPVLIDVPKDVQISLGEYNCEPVVEPFDNTLASDESIDKAVKLISDCKKPYIYIGGGVIGADIAKDIEAFADKIDAVIGCSLMGLSAVPTKNPRLWYASIAYAEQVGVNLQHGGLIGEINRR
jgi:acetolactate synthase-1/2/3 large subunit